MSDSQGALEPGVLPNLRYDVPAGLVVFLVALPLCLGIALASDAPLIAGIVSGVVAGLLVGPLSGSQLSVSGPAAGLTVLVAGGIAELGGYEAFLPAVVLAGVIQIVLGVLRGGVLANIFPSSVIEGMLAGIGVILILKQIPHALGRDTDYEGDLDFWLMGHQAHTFSEIEAAIRTPSPGVVIVTIVCLAILLLWQRPFIAKQAWSRIVPGPLVAVLAGVGINEMFGVAAPELFIRAEEGHMVKLPVLDSLGEFWRALPRPDWSRIGEPRVWSVAGTIAAVASLETLLSVEAVDKLDPYRRTSNTNRELMAQGVGNVVAGSLGGLPMTSVIVRSSTNVYSGGRTRISAVVHGILLGGLVLSVPFLLNRIPLAALAAVLLTVGYKLARVELFRKMYRAGADQFVPFLVTIAVTVFSDLLMGVMVGFAVGVVMVMITNFTTAISVVHEDGAWLVQFTKDVSFLNKTRLRRVLADIPPHSEVVIDGTRAMFIDHDIYEIVEDFKESAKHRDIRVECRRLDSKDHPIRLPGM
ncbi:MAG: SulP family inorganic anion transporter [Alphaproteobacteria bacterium]|nr:SulP family inorganic anion transporter [Alphaproteobacteria bacterium]